MKYYTDIISITLAEKLKERGMPMKVWDRTIQGIPYIIVMEKSSFDWLDKELGNTPSDVEVRYSIPTFWACFDWLETKGVGIGINHHWSGIVYQGYDWNVCQFHKTITPYFDTAYGTWHEAAEKAVEKALELI